MIVIEHPSLALAIVMTTVVFFGFHTSDFRLDASAESLVLEDDADLKYYRTVRERYGADDFLIIAYRPIGDLFSDTSLTRLRSLRDAIATVPGVDSVLTILDVPLLNSPRVALSELSTQVRTLETPGIDKDLVRQEFLESPLYHNHLVSPDLTTTALLINVHRDEQYDTLLQRRNHLRDKQRTIGLTTDEAVEFRVVIEAFTVAHANVLKLERERITMIRDIMESVTDQDEMYLGGISMITTDMIRFIEHDLVIFGIGVLGFLIIALTLFFRRLRWVVLPLTCCFISAWVMVGMLGLLDWNVTVISSNFISLLLIITMSLSIHLIVRFRILQADFPHNDQRTLVQDTVQIMAKPCFYTAITTIVAFGSLVVSGIRPVIDFGWMMAIGITFAFALNFLFLPAVLVMLKPESPQSGRDFTRSFTLAVASLTHRHAYLILCACTVLVLISVFGITQLEVENRFIDNFKSTTEIYRGMELIDTQLGGTTPLEIIINPNQEFLTYLDHSARESSDEHDDPFDDPFADDAVTQDTYWFHADMLTTLEHIHDYLDQLPDVGKVLSIATAFKILKQLNDDRTPDDFQLALIQKLMPADVKHALVSPYLSADGNQVRLVMRLIDSSPTLRRKTLIEHIRQFLIEDMNLAEEDIRFSGMVVLYNNMLQSLYTSQIATIGVVFASILVMFVILFRNLSLAILAIIPNLLAASTVLGLMGLLSIPLDMMTITIAAVTIGIAVDHAIHYVHRFQLEFSRNAQYEEIINRCHGSIGKAIYYTALTITVGFSILAFSNFIPTIYFGVLTGLAMVIALISNLTLLAVLLRMFRPLGPERGRERLNPT